jgi:serine protease inhibitor
MRKLLLSALVFLAIFSCTKDDYPVSPNDNSPNETITAKQVTEFREANTEFAIDLFRAVVMPDSLKENAMLSPLSVSIALSMLNNGTAGNTKTELKNALRYYDLPDYCINKGFRRLIDELDCYNSVMKLNLANSAWFDDSFPVKDDFVNSSKEFFDAGIKNIDLQSDAALDSVNSWTNEATDGMIPEMFSEMPPVVFLLCNAINFQGYWKAPFDPDETENKAFYFDGGGGKYTPTMQCNSVRPESPSVNFSYLIGDDFKAVKMPYGKKSYSESLSKTVAVPADNDNIHMYVFVPAGDLFTFINEKLTKAQWDGWMGSFKPFKELFPYADEFNFSLPKFKFGFEADLIPVMSALGMKDAFEAGASDFSNLTELWQGLFISIIKHITFIEVNEEGTSAAGLTVVGGSYGFTPEFKANKPFLFVIRDDLTGTILFMGQVYDPQY